MTQMRIDAGMQLLTGDIAQAEETFEAFCCQWPHFELLRDRLPLEH